MSRREGLLDNRYGIFKVISLIQLRDDNKMQSHSEVFAQEVSFKGLHWAGTGLNIWQKLIGSDPGFNTAQDADFHRPLLLIRFFNCLLLMP
ncbi:uncharacterized protein OCT59_028339 [Rhizophagus irregularis]|uniref:uncharacterized protein n=1 Tax=Rhizophagus irregularis TaxID=588596 RepID=UPI001C1802C8|nr:hypothetical protein OCT59_028339 [Rhizophagus irregularis]CAB4398307.1 unnamed protein product [Rhizophagus irregularis]CAB4473120.1 unnamed protein product [Rhizophagus irregularis]